MFRVGQLWTELRRVRQSWVKTAGDPLQPVQSFRSRIEADWDLTHVTLHRSRR